MCLLGWIQVNATLSAIEMTGGGGSQLFWIRPYLWYICNYTFVMTTLQLSTLKYIHFKCNIEQHINLKKHMKPHFRIAAIWSNRMGKLGNYLFLSFSLSHKYTGVARWLALLSHSKKVPGSNPGRDKRPFCVEFACSPCVSMSLLRVLRFPHTAQRHAG